MTNRSRDIMVTTGGAPSRHIVIAGAGYAGLHVALRLAASLERAKANGVAVTLVDTHDHHQLLTELPRVAAGTRAESAARVPLARVLARHATWLRTTVSGVDLDRRALVTAAGPLFYTRLVLALGSQPTGQAIPGLHEHALCLSSVDDAARVWAAVRTSVQMAAACDQLEERRRLLTVVIGGAGATGVELAGALAEELPALARRHGLPADLLRVLLLEAGPNVLAGASPHLSAKASAILAKLGVVVRTHTRMTAVTPEGVLLTGARSSRREWSCELAACGHRRSWQRPACSRMSTGGWQSTTTCAPAITPTSMWRATSPQWSTPRQDVQSRRSRRSRWRRARRWPTISWPS